MKALAAAKADRDYPIVSAASICAKVTRDTELRDWAFEPGLTGEAAPSRKFGCGYPGDADTKAWLLGNLNPVFGFPSIVRFSWATTKRLLEGEADAVPVQWCARRGRAAPSVCVCACEFTRRRRREADAEDEEAVGQKRAGRLPFGGCPSHLTTSSGAGRHAFMRSRKLQRVTAF